jgi:hypothetical protein
LDHWSEPSVTKTDSAATLFHSDYS